MEDQIGYSSRKELIREMELRLADGIVDVELDVDHYNTSINLALARYRQRSSGSVEESVIFIQTEPDIVEYTLPKEVMEVRRLYRQGVSSSTGGGVNFDPFDAAFNNMYLLNAGQTGGLAVFDFFSQYKETLGRIFGSEYDFHYSRGSRRLKLYRRIRTTEDVAVEVSMFVPEFTLLSDVYASNWLASYALCQAKLMLGEARSKYQSGLPGAGNSIILNGEQLKQEAREELQLLDDAIMNMEEGNTHLPFIIG